MPNETGQLDREALLVAYVADELPAAQKSALEVQLANDPALAAELARVRAALELAAGAVRQLDEHQRPPVQSAVAVRRASRAMQQWAVDRVSAKQEPVHESWSMPWWSYPAAAAAVLIVGFLIWSGRQTVPMVVAPLDSTNQIQIAQAEDLANTLEKQFAPTTQPSVDDSNESTVVADTEDLGAFFINPQEETIR